MSDVGSVAWLETDVGSLLVLSQNGCSKRRGKGIPTVVLRLADVDTNSGSIGPPETLRRVSLSDKERSKYALEPGDLLIIRVNGSRDLAGRVLEYRGPAGYAFCDHFIRLRVDQRSCKPQFIARLLNSRGTRTQIDAGIVSSAGQNTISQTTLRALRVKVPPLTAQTKVVDKLDALHARSAAARATLEAIPALLDRFRQSVLAAAFRGDLTRDWRAQNPDVEPASALLERIRAERRRRWIADYAEKARARAEKRAAKKGKPWTAEDDAKALEKGRRKGEQSYQAPDEQGSAGHSSIDYARQRAGWPSAVLDGVVDPARGIPYGIVKTGDPVVGGVPTVRCGDIKGFSIDVSSLKRVSPNLHAQYQRTELHGGEVLIAIRGTVGETAVATPDLRGGNISREVAMIPPLPGLNAHYVAYFLASPIGQEMLGDHIKGVAQSGINLRDLRQLSIPIPTEMEQRAIVERVESMLDLLRQVSGRSCSQAEALDRLDQSILAKAFRGELVPQDPNDEPASALLERIRAEREAAAPAKKRRGRKPRKPRKAKAAPTPAADPQADLPGLTTDG